MKTRVIILIGTAFLFLSCANEMFVDDIHAVRTDSSIIGDKKHTVGKWEVHLYKANTKKNTVFNENAFYYAYFDSNGHKIYPQGALYLSGIPMKQLQLRRIDSSKIIISDTLEMNGLYKLAYLKNKQWVDTLYFENGYLQWGKMHRGKRQWMFNDYRKRYNNERFSFYTEYFYNSKYRKGYFRPEYLWIEGKFFVEIK